MFSKFDENFDKINLPKIKLSHKECKREKNAERAPENSEVYSNLKIKLFKITGFLFINLSFFEIIF